MSRKVLAMLEEVGLLEEVKVKFRFCEYGHWVLLEIEQEGGPPRKFAGLYKYRTDITPWRYCLDDVKTRLIYNQCFTNEQK